MFISKSIERIADHATNIAEEMIYLSQGKDVRHSDEVKKLPATVIGGVSRS
jgi:phosphate transport system protein